MSFVKTGGLFLWFKLNDIYLSAVKQYDISK